MEVLAGATWIVIAADAAGAAPPPPPPQLAINMTHIAATIPSIQLLHQFVFLFIAFLLVLAHAVDFGGVGHR
jgi:hypothetical protein